MLGRDEGSKFLHRLCRHHFFCEVVPVRNSFVWKKLFFCLFVFSFFFFGGGGRGGVVSVFALPKEKQRLLFLANLLMMLLEVKSDLLVVLISLLFHTGVRKDSAGIAADETFGNFIKKDEALLSLSVLKRWQVQVLHHLCYGARLVGPVILWPVWQNRQHSTEHLLACQSTQLSQCLSVDMAPTPRTQQDGSLTPETNSNTVIVLTVPKSWPFLFLFFFITFFLFLF